MRCFPKRALALVGFLLPTLLQGKGTRLRLTRGIQPEVELSVRLETEQALKKGFQWLEAHQNEDGSWSQPELPGITALALTSFFRSPDYDAALPLPPPWRKGFHFVLSRQQPDGGIYVKGYSNYNTCLAIMALAASGRPDAREPLTKAQRFVASLQDETGGIGYGGSERRDLNNTTYAIEALREARDALKDTGQTAKVNWDLAISFLGRCQHLPGKNPEPWVSDDKENRGGFVYRPGESKAGTVEGENGLAIPRSYGSISYAGLLSLLYADVDRDDPRVQAAVKWLQRHYTLEENPGLGQQSLFYYYHTMAKALTAYRMGYLETEDGEIIHWREALLERLLSLQKEDGRWVNENARWMENDPSLVTSYTLLSMEMLLKAEGH